MSSMLTMPCQRCSVWKNGLRQAYGWTHLCQVCFEELVAIDEERKEHDMQQAGRVPDHARGQS